MRLLILLLLFIVTVSCEKSVVYAPESSTVNQRKPSVSQERAKNLNLLERKQIEDWISKRKEKFYPTSLNYWVDQPDFNKRTKRSLEETISYMYYIFDFNEVRIYDKPKGYRDIQLQKFPNDLKPVEDALRYMNNNEEITLLIPSALAYGTYGDGDKIDHDLPIIIKLKLIK